MSASDLTGPLPDRRAHCGKLRSAPDVGTELPARVSPAVRRRHDGGRRRAHRTRRGDSARRGGALERAEAVGFARWLSSASTVWARRRSRARSCEAGRWKNVKRVVFTRAGRRWRTWKRSSKTRPRGSSSSSTGFHWMLSMAPGGFEPLRRFVKGIIEEGGRQALADPWGGPVLELCVDGRSAS